MPRAGILVGVLLAATASAAAAHQRLLATDPPRDGIVQTVPRELRLSFYEPVEVGFTRIELLGPDGSPVALGSPRLHPDSAMVVFVPIEGRLGAGRHLVRWSTASRDGHPVRGEFGFSIAAGAAGLVEGDADRVGGQDGAAARASGAEPLAPERHPAASQTVFDAGSAGYVAIRWLTYLALLGIVGAVSFGVLVLGRVGRRGVSEDRELILTARRRAAGLGLAFALLLLVAAGARLYAQSLAMHGPDGALDLARIATMLRRTLWGWGWMLQVGAGLAAVLGFLLARRGSNPGWLLAGLATLALVATPGLAGHAAAVGGDLGLIALASHAVHVLAAGAWLGGLLVLLLAGVPEALRLGSAQRNRAVSGLVEAFSPTALIFASLLVLSGLFAAVLHVGSIAGLLDSAYGRILLVKIGVFLLLLATGAYNYLSVRPGLREPGTGGRLRLSSTAELAIATLVLLLTAVLAATPPPTDAATDLVRTESASRAP